MPLNFSKHWNYTDISPLFWNLPIFLIYVKLQHWLEIVPSRLLSISCPDDLQMLNSRRSCLTSPIVTDGRIYIPSTVSSGDEYILLLHSKYRTEISTKHFCLSAPVTIWQEQGRSNAECQARVVPQGGSCRPRAPHTPVCWVALGHWCVPAQGSLHAFACTEHHGSLMSAFHGLGFGAVPLPPCPKDKPSAGHQCKFPI